MYLIQIFLPLRDNRGRPITQRNFERLAKDLGRRFGGMTAYTRAPATGLWKRSSGGRAKHDDVVIYEVMAARLERRWWKRQRVALQATFRQEQILIRGHGITRL
jgi:hypothetical protein